MPHLAQVKLNYCSLILLFFKMIKELTAVVTRFWSIHA